MRANVQGTRGNRAIRLLAAVGVAGGVALAGPIDAVAQNAPAPVVSLGGDLSFGPDGEGVGPHVGLRLGPRLAVDVSPRTALDVSLAYALDHSGFAHVDYLFVDLRRSLVSSGRSEVFGTLGVAHSTRVIDDESFREQFPQFATNDYSIGPSIGIGTMVRVAPRLQLRAAAQFVWSEESTLRFVGGATVPVGGHPPLVGERPPAPDLRAAALRPLRPGQTVRVVLDDGREVAGQVVSLTTDSATIRSGRGAAAIAASSVRRVDVPDTLHSGIAIGALAGGGAGGVFGFYAGLGICESDVPCATIMSLLFGGMGAGVGALSGAVADSFHDDWQPAFRAGDAARIVVTPVVARGVVGAGGRVAW